MTIQKLTKKSFLSEQIQEERILLKKYIITSSKQ
jgi:hypothetical protein